MSWGSLRSFAAWPLTGSLPGSSSSLVLFLTQPTTLQKIWEELLRSRLGFCSPPRCRAGKREQCFQGSIGNASRWAGAAEGRAIQCILPVPEMHAEIRRSQDWEGGCLHLIPTSVAHSPCEQSLLSRLWFHPPAERKVVLMSAGYWVDWIRKT
jgi:hypothetical protein